MRKKIVFSADWFVQIIFLEIFLRNILDMKLKLNFKYKNQKCLFKKLKAVSDTHA